MPLTGLAALIYPILQNRVPADDPRLSYEDLVTRIEEVHGALPPPDQNLQAFDARLFDALGQIGNACHAADLPALSAIVVQRTESGLGMPGAGYYPATHPHARNDEQRIEAWLTEYGECRQAQYPARL